MNQLYIELVDKWLAESASTEELDQLWAAALTNSELFEYMKTVAGVKKVMLEREQRDSKPTPAKITRLNYWIAAAAIVLLSISGGLLIKINRDAHQVSLLKIDLMDLEGANITRSSGKYFSEEDSLLTLGIKAIIDGKKSKAKELLSELIQKSPESSKAGLAYYNLGILSYNDGKFEQSLEQFQKTTTLVTDDEYVVEKAMWFIAHNQINLNQLEAARETALQMYTMNLAMRKRAFILIKELDQKLKFQTFDDDFEFEEN